MERETPRSSAGLRPGFTGNNEIDDRLNGGVPIYVDFHVHTNRSPDGIHSPRVTVKYAQKAGLDALAITDHNRLFSRTEARRLSREFGMLVIPGIEGGRIALDRHWIGLGIEAIPPTPNIDRIIEYVSAEGGLSIAPHPHSAAGYSNYTELGFDAVEAINGTDRLSNLLVKNILHIPEIAGSDAHAGYMLGYVWTDVPGAGSRDDLFAQVKAGRCAAEGALIPLHKRLQYYGEVVGRNVVCEPRTFFSSMQTAFCTPRSLPECDAYEPVAVPSDDP